MHRFVVSTVGTSLLSNQIRQKDPKNWQVMIDKTANWTEHKIQKYEPDVIDIILELKNRAEEKLYDGNILNIREASAELNGIYGLYQEQINQGKQDIHFLLASDTYQNKITSEILQSFLINQGINISINTPAGFTTGSNEAFTQGIDELLNWFEETIPGYKDSGYEICFNLVGGFKAIQGFVNTFGMFYADKIIYIFEGVNSELITIPRLPIKINTEVIKPVEFALMAAENSVAINVNQLAKVPESLIFVYNDEAILSNWGRLTWNNCKYDLFKKDLLLFPCLVYEKSFEKDYLRHTVDDKIKYELHSALAEISATMLKFNGDTSRINKRFRYKRYEGSQKCEGGLKKNEIDHFYLNKNEGWRVSCVIEEIKDSQKKTKKVLRMRHFGEHDYVNDNP